MLERRIDELFDFGEGYNLVKLSPDFGFAHAKNRTAQKDVFTAREFGVKSSSDFEERAHPPAQLSEAAAWLRNSGKNLQKSALAGAVATDDSCYFALADIERNVLQRPDV